MSNLSSVFMGPWEWQPAPPPPRHHHENACGCEPTIAYVRVSMVGLRETLISPDIQLAEIVQDAVRSNKRIVRVVSDINASGRTFTKRSVISVIESIRRGEARSITVWKWSRWGRNLEYSLAYISLVKQAGGRVDSATEDIDQSTAHGRFGRDMLMRVDQLVSELIGEGWRAAHDHRRRRGLPHSGRPRFGYDYIDGGYVPNRRDADTLRWAYESYVAGTHSYGLLARTLNARGVNTTRGYKWTVQALSKVMDNGFAAGLIRERSSERKAEQRDRSPERRLPNACAVYHYDVWRKGAHQPIIDEELWAAYLAMRPTADNKKPSQSGRAKYTLSGLVFCAVCDRRMTIHHSGRTKEARWRCDWRGVLHPEVTVSALGNEVEAFVREWLGDRATPEAHAKRVAEYAASKDVLPPTNDDALRAELAEVDRRLRRLVRLFAQSEDDSPEFERAFTAERKELERQSRELSDQLLGSDATAPVADLAAFRTLSEGWDGFPASVRRAALSRIVGKVVVSQAARRGESAAGRVTVVPAWVS